MKLRASDKRYPALLRQIFKPPAVLFCKGNLELLSSPCISIVGTRRSSDYGEFMTRKIINELSATSLTIVSGLAKGIDTIAHDAAIKNNMPTIAVLGSGMRNIYPQQNKNLAERIKEKGLIVTEYEDEETPQKCNFPKRNRIISGLSIATLVIEAPEKSGALITAKLALEQNREVFVIPGDADEINSMGIIKLLQKGGAYPVSSGKEIIDVLNEQSVLPCFNTTPKASGLARKPAANQSLIHKFTSLESKILGAMPVHRGINIDQIYQKLIDATFQQIEIQKLLEAISMLELKRLILLKDGKYYRK
jgi:DNA processing protein